MRASLLRGASTIGLIAAAVVALGWGRPAAAAGTAIPAAPTRFASDEAGFLSEASRAALDERLARFEKDSGHQVLLWV
ncbi:MAG TPA: hypothetical protein VHU40_03295, partial [Polyangia bacterium]|nr:hypothetical protein [Polyangia bacterium]